MAGYIERAGSGTQAMFDFCREEGLPEPQFEQRGGSFVTTLWRDWMTQDMLAGYNLNERQMKVIIYLKIHQNITNTIYQSEFTSSKRTASRDLDEMMEKGII